MPAFLPILSCAEARDFESRLFARAPDRAIAFMRDAGRALAREALAAPGANGRRRLLVLFGKGANGADVLFAARRIADTGMHCAIAPAFDRERWSHAVMIAHDELMRAHPCAVVTADTIRTEAADALVLDGLTGSGFRPPLSPELARMIRETNAAEGAFVVAADLPSGAGDIPAEPRIRADMTVTAGILKRPLLADEDVRRDAGRIRFADIGLFSGPADTGELVATAAILRPLRRPLPPGCDKRSRGRLAIFGGSPRMPGALLLNTLGALRAGAGLVAAHAPASAQPAFAAAAPEALWAPVPETEGIVRWENAVRDPSRTLRGADAALCGSGLGDTPDAAALARILIREFPGKLILDADALRPAILAALADRPPEFARVALTPHAGEFRRIAGEAPTLDALRRFADHTRAIVVLKGPATRVAEPGRVALVPHGGPALARAGSGDVLAGVIGALLARENDDPFATVCRAVAWHGLAGDTLASARGELTLRTSDLPEALGPALNATGDREHV